MSQTVASYMLSRLTEWGVKRVFGYPGDGINGLMGAWHEHEDELDFIQCRHEEIASFAATAEAKVTGDVAVCMATSGPGAIHLLNGLYDAKLHYQQEVDLVTLFKDVAHEYVHVCMAPQQARQLIDRAIRIAKAERTVTCVIVPNDVQESPWEEPPRQHGAMFSSVGFHEPRVLPHDEDLRRAAE